MFVKTILKNRKNNEVSTVVINDSVSEAAGKLHSYKIGALVVVDTSGNIIGILSERDIVRGLAKNGEKIFSQKVGDLMTANVLLCKPDDSIKDIMNVMTEKRIRHLPVVDQGNMVGIITIGDVVKSSLDEAAMQVDNMREYVMASR